MNDVDKPLTCPNCKGPAGPSFSAVTMRAVFDDPAEQSGTGCSVGPWGYLCKTGRAAMGPNAGCAKEDYDRAPKPWGESRVRERLSKDCPMMTMTIQVPEDVLRDLGLVATRRGFESPDALVRAYVGQGLREDLAKPKAGGP